MGNIRIAVMTNQDEQFYPLVGPFLAQRKVIHDLGFPPYDDEGKVWFIALVDSLVAGFVGLRLEDKAVFCSDYIRPEYRRQGIYKQLMAERLSYSFGQANSAIAVVSLAGQRCYEEFGFVQSPQAKHRLKRYLEMARSLK